MADELGWEFEPGRPVVSVSDHRLNRMLMRHPFRYATLSEYATATGIGIEGVVEQLSPYLDCGSVGLETYDGEVFLLTAPRGRPMPAEVPDIAPNLWEALRVGAPIEAAHHAWALCRSLERAGWSVVTDPRSVFAEVGRLSHPPQLALKIGSARVPVVTRVPDVLLAEPTGVLAEYERMGAPAVAVVCPAGRLDSATTAVRRWVVSRQSMPTALTVIVLEMPGLSPVVMSAADAAVTPVSVDRSTLSTMNWADRSR